MAKKRRDCYSSLRTLILRRSTRLFSTSMNRDADGLYNYRAPAPSASTVNIAYFVGNGYLVFDPNIYYKNGEPGESAYNSVVSAAKHMAKMPGLILPKWLFRDKAGVATR